YHGSITESSIGQIKTIGLLGDKYIDLSIGNPGETPLPENSWVSVMPPFDFEAAGPKLSQALNEFTEVLGDVKGIVATIQKGEGSVGRIIKQPTVAIEMEKFFAS